MIWSALIRTIVGFTIWRADISAVVEAEIGKED